MKNNLFRDNLLTRAGMRFLWHHPWLFGLSVLGVALGVAMVVSIDLANHSAREGFRLSSEAVSGDATHQVRSTSGGLSEETFTELRKAGFRQSAPVIEEHLNLEADGRTLQLLGIDPIAEGNFRTFASREGGVDPGLLMANPQTGLISQGLAENIFAEKGDSLELSFEGVAEKIAIAGFIEAPDERSQVALENVLVTDISTAQELLNKTGQLSRIDLILPDDEKAEEHSALTKILPEGTMLESVDDRRETMGQMTEAFELNLQALSMLALLVGMFLIYSTMSFSVVQRRPIIGRLRALGATRNEIFLTILREALIIGLLGTIAGLTLGIVLAQGLVQLVTRTINDLYFVLTVQELSLDPFTLLKGIVLGLFATLAATFFPAREAAVAPVSTVLQSSGREASMRTRLPSLTVFGLLVGFFGASLLLIPASGIIIGYLSLLLMIVGFALMVPFLVTQLSALLRPAFAYFTGITGKMACRGIVSNLSRTSVAIASLSVAVAATLGVGIMVDSFRTTIDVWIVEQLQGDINVYPPSQVARLNQGEIDLDIAGQLRNAEGVALSHGNRNTEVKTEYGRDHLMAMEQGYGGREAFQVKNAVPDLWETFREKSRVYITEVYANRNDLEVGDSLQLETPKGPTVFPIGAVYYDYGSDLGVVSMSREVYKQYFDDHAISTLTLHAAEGQDLEQLIHRLRDKIPDDQQLYVEATSSIREASLDLFDRTFVITDVLRLLAILVAFIGVLTALMALQLERSRELAVLRANGMTPSQLWSNVTLQTGIMGAMAGIIAFPLGLIKAAVLVYVINLRSFGWTLQFHVAPEVVFQGFVLAVFAALIVGIYPSLKMAKAKPADALRNE